MSTRFLPPMVAGLCAVLASNNWCLVCFPAAFAGFLADWAACRHLRPVWRIAIAAAAGSLIGLRLSVGADWAFREAFGMEKPVGIRNVHVQRYYQGGPGEDIVLVEFVASQSALRTLVRHVKAESDRLLRWQASGASWAKAFDCFTFGEPTWIARESWLRIPAIENPEVLDLGDANGGELALFALYQSS